MKTKQIKGYPEYTVNTDGIIVSYKKELKPRVLKHSVGKIGYCNVGLVDELGIKKTLSVHCIIADTGVKSVSKSFGFTVTFDRVLIGSQGHETPLDAYLSRLGLVETINNL